MSSNHIFRHLKLKIALANSPLKDWKIETNNSVTQGYSFNRQILQFKFLLNEVVSRWRDSPLQVSGNYLDLTK